MVGNEVVSCHSIEAGDVEKVLEACDRWQLPCIVVGAQHIGVYRHNALVDEIFSKGLGLHDFVYTPLDSVLKEPIIQLTPFITTEQERELLASSMPATAAAGQRPSPTSLTPMPTRARDCWP
jgi:phosphoribosylformylglycinamidine (FGAM) synthase-like enzyme